VSELIGQLLGNQYQVIEVLGTGGMATVYRARQTSVDRDVAIKVIRSEIAQQSDFQQRFERSRVLPPRNPLSCRAPVSTAATVCFRLPRHRPRLLRPLTESSRRQTIGR
jgi:hypothetical protein